MTDTTSTTSTTEPIFEDETFEDIIAQVRGGNAFNGTDAEGNRFTITTLPRRRGDASETDYLITITADGIVGEQDVANFLTEVEGGYLVTTALDGSTVNP